MSIVGIKKKGYYQIKGRSFFELAGKALLLLQTRKEVRKVLRTIDIPALKKIRQRYSDRTDPMGPEKYFDVEKWVWDRMCDAYRLKIHKRKVSTILDIGTGFGYFPFICQHFGHTVHTIDIETEQMFTDVITLLNVPRSIQRIERFKPLPYLGQRFDIITGYMVCFNNHKEQNVWNIAEWDYFLKDLANNHCKGSSELFFLLNPENCGSFYSVDLKKYFIEAGATVRRNEVYFKSISRISR